MIRGEIWWGEFGIPYGSEIGYSRPVLIVQDDGFNESRINTIVVLPLTSNLRLLDAPCNVLVRKIVLFVICLTGRIIVPIKCFLTSTMKYTLLRIF